jgi:hypothetical protein
MLFPYLDWCTSFNIAAREACSAKISGLMYKLTERYEHTLEGGNVTFFLNFKNSVIYQNIHFPRLFTCTYAQWDAANIICRLLHVLWRKNAGSSMATQSLFFKTVNTTQYLHNMSKDKQIICRRVILYLPNIFLTL